MIRSWLFEDREGAGRALARAVEHVAHADPVVLALPRGGVPVGFEVAKKLHAPLDIIQVRKIGAPFNKEFGIGAVVEGSPPQLVVDQAAAQASGASESYIQAQILNELQEIERRRALYRTAPPVPLKDRSVVLVDDGIATGSTVKAALKGLSKAGARKIILAVPLAPQDTLESLSAMCDDIICLESPSNFGSVGAWYRNFEQTSDAQVGALLQRSRAWLGPVGM